MEEIKRPAGEPGGSATIDPKTTFIPETQEVRASKAIINAAEDLPLPTTDPRWDPTNIILDTKKAEREAPTEPSRVNKS